MSDKCREAFEKHYWADYKSRTSKSFIGTFCRLEDDFYAIWEIELAWRAYQAGRADLERENAELKATADILLSALYHICLVLEERVKNNYDDELNDIIDIIDSATKGETNA